MKIILADVLGFCFGVRRAVLLAQKALSNKNTNQGKVYSLGPLIHNETVLEQLESKGLEILQEDQINNVNQKDTVIIRAHGVPPKIIAQLEKTKCNIIDATCTRVKASQKMVSQYTKQNDIIVFCGDHNHGEVKSIEGYASKNFFLIQNQIQALELDQNILKDKQIVLCSQTTFSTDEFTAIEQILNQKKLNIIVKNTICPATSERQESLIKLCTMVQGILVIGGKSSANTKRLYQIAKKNCKNVALIQSENDIPKDFYSLSTVGITAGASTPDEIITQVKNNLENSSCF